MITPVSFQLLASQGYTHLTLQIGQGEFEPDPPNEGVSVEWYRYKQTLRDDMSSAALIISHGGDVMHNVTYGIVQRSY